MATVTGFNSERYLEEQSKAILERAERFGNKLYLEFGGKIIYDMHASRVLPGFDANAKMRLLQRLKDKTLRAPSLARMVQERFGISVHPRSIERALSRRQKRGR